MSKNKLIAITAMGCLLLAAAGQAEETIHFREGGGEGYTDVTFDDTWVFYDPADDTTHGNDSYNGIRAGGSRIALIAVKSLFTELPATSAGCNIQINSATLHLFRYNTGSSSVTVSIYPITTNWLPDSAGANENDVSGENAEVSESTTWASGDWSSSDYDSSVCNTGNWVDSYNEECELDVTDVIADIYDNDVNYGMVLHADGAIIGRASENSSNKPSLEITYEYISSGYTLTVNSGTGGGTYDENDVADISADAAPSGQEFDEWIGDTSGIANVSASSTTLTMPAANQEVTATYTDKKWTLTVNSGTGDGDYVVGTEVPISADTPPSGQEFDEWVGDVSGIANVNASSTTLTMPYADAEVTATYTDITYTLTVNSGSGDGSYPETQVVDITADTAPSGMLFDKWTGDTSGIADVNDPSTTLTMPANNQEITAVYTWVVSGLMSRYTFDVDARDTYGANDGTLTNGASVTNDGTRGLVLSLDGADDYVDLPSGSMTAGRSEVTLTMWINADEWATSDAIYDEYYTSTYDYWQFSLTNDSFFTRDSSTGSTGSRNNDLTMPSMSAGIWYNLAVVYSDSNDLKAIYLDGVLKESTNQSIDTLTSDRTAARIGYPADGTHFDGMIDDVRLYSRALNLTELALLAEKTPHALTVNSGTGAGDYCEGQIVDISAGAAATGYEFSEWVGDTDGIANLIAPQTTITMPGSNAEITATYAQTLFALTVNSGTGDGSYAESTVVDIDADTAPTGMTFDKWVGDTSGIANLTAASTTLTMPDTDQEVTATYTDVTYTLTVNSGTGDGSYSVDTVVDISADAAASGELFDAWTGDTSGIADVNDPTTTLTMPAANPEVTATYTKVVDGLVSRYTFDIDGRDSYGTNNGTLTGGASVTNDATRGMVLSLDGTDDYVDLPESNMAAGRSALTLSMWVKPDTWDSGDTIYDEYASGNYWQFTILNASLYTRDSSTGTTGSRDNDLSMSTLSTGAWQHLAVVYDAGSDVKAIYLDGEQDTSTSTSVDTLTSTRDGARIGYPCDGTYFDGMIDDVRLYNRALSGIEIALLAGETAYTLTVNSGTGDGEYMESQVVNVSADSPASGKQFDEWVGDTSHVASVTSSSTTVTMPAGNVEITATYEDVPSGTTQLIVDWGDSAGNNVYDFSDWDTVYLGQYTGYSSLGPDGLKAGWTGTGMSGSVSGSDEGFVSGDQIQVTWYNSKTSSLTFTPKISFDDPDKYNSGASGTWYDMTQLNCSAESSGTTTYTFDSGSAGTYNLVNVCRYTNDCEEMVMDKIHLITEGGSPTTYTLTVNSGTGDGDYTSGTNVNISADAAPSGRVFDEWTGDTTNIADVSDPTTTITMPAADAEITATYETAYTLTVNSGSGDGSYAASTIVNISADSPPSGQQFDEWTGDTSNIADVNDSDTTITMPSGNAEITATYEASSDYTLTVNSGSGDGSYAASTVVNIAADTAPGGYGFDEWVGDTSGIADVTDPTTTLTMPAANQEITATYSLLYTLTVNSGSGDGNYISGTVIDITADAAPSGKTFDDWIGDTSGIANVNASSTTLTMPAADAEITATYVDSGPAPSISSVSGTISHGESITISGSGFGSKSTAAPYKYDDFEDGSLGQRVGNGWYTSSNLSDGWPIYSSAQKRATGRCEVNAYLQHDRAYNSTLGITGLNWGWNREAYLSAWYYCTTSGANSRNFKIWAFRGGGAGDWGEPEIRVDMYPKSGAGHAYIADCYNGKIIDDWSVGGNVMAGQWNRVELWMHTGTSSSGDNDGVCTGWRNLSQWWHMDDFEYDHSVQDFDNIYLASYFARDDGTPTPCMWWYYDEVYIDTTQSRVEIGNNSTWSGCSHREVQIPSAWSSSSVTVTVNQGTFADSSGAYLYVVDSDGNVNTNGYSITFAD